VESSADLRSVLIAKIRELDLTQRESAKAIGVSQQALSSWVSGDTIPSRTQVPRIAAFLGRPEDEVRQMRVKAAEQDIGVVERIDHLEDAVDALTVQLEEIRTTQHELVTMALAAIPAIPGASEALAELRAVETPHAKHEAAE